MGWPILFPLRAGPGWPRLQRDWAGQGPHLECQLREVLPCPLHNEAQPENGAVQVGHLIKRAVFQIAVLPVLDVAPEDAQGIRWEGHSQDIASTPAGVPSPTLRLLLGESELGVVDAVLDEDGEIWGHLTKKLAEEAETGCV